MKGKKKVKKQQYWLMKSEPLSYSIDDLLREKQAEWDGVRNYQARNYMRDDMSAGDKVLFYHSSCDEVGVAGIARVCKEGYPDHTAWSHESMHKDPKSTKENPIWYMVDVCFEEKFDTVVSLKDVKSDPFFNDMPLVQRGQRLSIQPVSKKHFDKIYKLGQKG